MVPIEKNSTKIYLEKAVGPCEIPSYTVAGYPTQQRSYTATPVLRYGDQCPTAAPSKARESAAP